jgi:hypothetical protein
MILFKNMFLICYQNEDKDSVYSLLKDNIPYLTDDQIIRYLKKYSSSSKIKYENLFEIFNDYERLYNIFE